MIRRAEATDIADIAALAAQLGGVDEVEAFPARLQRLLEHASHAVFAGLRDDAEGKHAVAGFAAAEHRIAVQGEWVEITALVVDADARGQGLGAQLVAAVEAWSARRGVARIVVRSNVLREAAHPFYLGLGYAQSKTQHVYAKSLR